MASSNTLACADESGEGDVFAEEFSRFESRRLVIADELNMRFILADQFPQDPIASSAEQFEIDCHDLTFQFEGSVIHQKSAHW